MKQRCAVRPRILNPHAGFLRPLPLASNGLSAIENRSAVRGSVMRGDAKQVAHRSDVHAGNTAELLGTIPFGVERPNLRVSIPEDTVPKTEKPTCP